MNLEENKNCHFEFMVSNKYGDVLSHIDADVPQSDLDNILKFVSFELKRLKITTNMIESFKMTVKNPQSHSVERKKRGRPQKSQKEKEQS